MKTSFGVWMMFFLGIVLAFGIYKGITAAAVIAYILMGIFSVVWVLVLAFSDHLDKKLDFSDLTTGKFIFGFINVALYVAAGYLSGNFTFLYFYITYVIFAYVSLARLAWVNKGLPNDPVLQKL